MAQHGGSSVVEARLTVCGVVDESPDTRTIQFANPDGLIPPHRPGQHAKVGVETVAGTAWKSFTISSPPTRPATIDLTIRRNPEGIVSTKLHAFQPGSSAIVKGPSGGSGFVFEGDRGPLVLIVAGIGVTPAICILRTLDDRRIERPITLIYGCRTAEGVLFAEEIEELRSRSPGFTPLVTLSRPDAGWPGRAGRIGPDLLSQALAEAADGHYFVCGPGDFNPSVRSWLDGRGVPADRVHEEVFRKKPR